MNGHTKLKHFASYIKPLDGLRAIAILLVLLFHMDVKWFSGGFIGVDIFFTISGFIITRNIFLSLGNDSFSLLGFYRKRLSRLLPSTVVTIVSSLIIASYIYHPETVAVFARSGIYSIVSFANIHFLLNSGYFDYNAQSNIFLHTWSLSVEEQFYLLWPFFTLLIWPHLKKTPIILFSIFTISTFFSFLFSMKYPNAAFYLMPTRIFQFSLGAAIAWTNENNSKYSLLNYCYNSPLLCDILFFIGIIMIFLSSVLANGEKFNFFVSSILPIVGAGAILFSINTDLSERVLGSKLLCIIGKRAYSLYLVHWPVIVMSGVLFGKTRPLYVDLSIIAICFILAELLHQGIEKPLRLSGVSKVKNMNRLKTKTALAGIAMGLIVAVYFYSVPTIKSSNPFDEVNASNLISSESHSLLNKELITSSSGVAAKSKKVAYTIYAGRLWAVRSKIGRIDLGCQLSNDAPYSDYNEVVCVPKTEGSPKILVLGDSFAPETLIFLEQVFSADKLLLAGTSGCLPVYPEPHWANRSAGCQELNQKRFEWVNRDDVEAVAISSNWQYWTPITFRQTMNYLVGSGKRVIIFGVRPIFTTRVPELLDSVVAQSAAKNLNDYISYDYKKIQSMISDELNSLQGQDRLLYINLMKYFCPNNECQAFTPDGKLMYLDNAHIPADTAVYIGRQINQTKGKSLRKFLAVDLN